MRAMHRSSQSKFELSRGSLRRGNTIVLVTGILVLLVIIATAYVTRTQAGRVTATAQQRAILRDDLARNIADSLAAELAEALFVHPINLAPATPVQNVDSNAPRLPPAPNAVRYGVDPNFPFNFAPYSVAPTTNFNDPSFYGPGLTATLFPKGPGNNLTPTSVFLLNEWNMIGNPGFGDTRWLCDPEPTRFYDTINNDGVPDLFSHWRHLSNIARADNGWRIIAPISNVDASIVQDLNIPVEQWLTVPPVNVFSAAGDPAVPANFETQWGQWLGFTQGLVGYQNAYADPSAATSPGIPMNRYHLRDLDGDNVWNEVGERPQDEFVPGTLRWRVCRVLADADGDGWTDSFWFLAPTSVNSGIRQVVAVRIVDNCGKFPANAALRFCRNDGDFNQAIAHGATWPGRETRGILPTDLGLTGQNDDLAPGGAPMGGLGANSFNVGFFDNPWHWVMGSGGLNTAYNFAAWEDHLREIGFVLNGTGGLYEAPDTLQRAQYWRQAASAPLSTDVGSPFTPFGLSDEIELRMYAGQNYSWDLTRFENSSKSPNTSGILHSAIGRDESNEFQRQLLNYELVRDLRDKTTLYSAARNDLMPPWLWKTLNTPERKLDLRLLNLGNTLDVNNDGTVDLIDARLRLRNVIEQCLIEPEGNPLIPNPNSYYGFSGLDKTRELAAAMAANIWQWRDRNLTAAAGEPFPPEVSPLTESIPVQPATGGGPTTDRFIGMEPQPFLVEAFIGHDYKAYDIPATDFIGVPYTDAGNHVILNAPDHRTTIVAVQIANPFNRPINLADFRLSVFGKDYDIPATPTPPILPPGTDDKPATAIIYAIDGAFDTQFAEKWQQFFDIDTGDLPNTSIILNATAALDTDRTIYDDNGTASAIEIARRDLSQTAPTYVVLDRIDAPTDRKFGDAVNDMKNSRPQDTPAAGIGQGPDDEVGVPAGGPYPIGVKIGQNYTHWVQWRRVTRAWGADLDGNGTYDPNEKNPRYVFGDRAISKPFGPAVTDPNTDGPTFISDGDRYKFDQVDPDTPVWFTRQYFNPAGVLIATHKPTFFDMNRAADPAAPNRSFPDKGWYSQTNASGSGVDVTPVNAMRLKFAMQMLQKDGDFEQAGELYNVWMYGHKVDATDLGAGQFNYTGTKTTFSEYLANDNDAITGGPSYRINRLYQLTKPDLDVVLPDQANLNGLGDPRQSWPPLPAGLRLFDAFVCDGPGAIDYDQATLLDPSHPLLRDRLGSFGLAMGFAGRGTPGLINIVDAPIEVMQALPHWYRLVHETGKDLNNNPLYNGAGQPLVIAGNDPNALLPRSLVAEALWQYREKLNGLVNPLAPNIRTGISGGPNYENRTGPRGMSSPAEIMLLDRPGNAIPGGMIDVPPVPPQYAASAVNDKFYDESWLLGAGVTDPAAGAKKPFWDGPGNGAHQVSLRLSTDREDEYDPVASTVNPLVTKFRPDDTAGDAEEANMLFAGASNMVTTRSDTFTVYFRVRSFRQNTSVYPPVWDATNPDYIVDDSRYVMLVDRSNVNRPGDKPKILYMEKLPN